MESEVYIGNVPFEEGVFILKYKVDRFSRKVSQLQEELEYVKEHYDTPFPDKEKSLLEVFKLISDLGGELRDSSFDIDELGDSLLMEYKEASQEDKEEPCT